MMTVDFNGKIAGTSLTAKNQGLEHFTALWGSDFGHLVSICSAPRVRSMTEKE